MRALTSRSIRSRSLLAAAACLTFALASPARADEVRQIQNLVPAMYSFDSSLALLGLRYGFDPTRPVFTADGTYDDNGFSWSTSGAYLGQPLSLSATGTFDTVTNSLTWSGGGSYAGIPWVLEGTTEWSTASDFAIMDSISIGGVNAIFSGTLGAPGFNSGTLACCGPGDIQIIELGTRHWLSWLVGPSTDGWVVSITQPTGIITANVYTESSNDSKVGVTVDGGHPAGSITIGGTKWVKAGVVNPVPEPGTWAMMLIGFTVVGLTLRRGRKRLAFDVSLA